MPGVALGYSARVPGRPRHKTRECSDMGLDGIALSGVRRELEERLLGGRVQKIYQPASLEVALLLYRGARERLRISAHPADPIIYLTSGDHDQQGSPPPFCLLLRKHLEGARLTAISQVRVLERVLEMEFEASELSGGGRRRLVVELMGKHSNIILLGENGSVIDAIRRVTPSMSRHRQVLPGERYALPPSQDKMDPSDLDPGSLAQVLAQGEGGHSQRLVAAVAGVGPVTAREAVHRCTGDPETYGCLAAFLREMAVSVREGTSKPSIVWGDDQKMTCYAPFDLTHLEQPTKDKDTYPSINHMLDAYYLTRFAEQTLETRRAKARRAVKAALERAERRVANLREDLLEARKAPEYRRFGELIMANLHHLPGGNEASLEDFGSPGTWTTVPLDSRLSPVKNAQEYFRKYNKAKKGLEAIKVQLEKAQREVAYLEQSLLCIDQARSPEEADSILEELEAEGYLGAPARKKATVRRAPRVTGAPSVPGFLSRSGARIYVGRNNRQNDFITMRLASPEDVWLHARNIPGSHVLLKSEGKTVSHGDLVEAAMLAAYHSRARQGSQVPVDYALRRDVWKPRGAKPGMVLYRNHHTIFVTPDENSVKAIMERGQGDLGGNPSL